MVKYSGCRSALGYLQMGVLRGLGWVLLLLVVGCSRAATENRSDAGQQAGPTSLSQAEAVPVAPSAEQPSPSSQADEEENMTATATEESSAGNNSTEEPLLLLEESDDGQDTHLMADNSRCFVCHLNFQFEDIALVHAREGYGCAYCHGPSDAHIADESWASGGNGTAPDIMYRPNEVIPACLKCHELSKSDPECHCDFPRLPQKKSCTDCHGNHRLKERKCHWK